MTLVAGISSEVDTASRQENASKQGDREFPRFAEALNRACRTKGGMSMAMRRAACSCGKLEIMCSGEPVRISICHCLACQRRTGAVFGGQAWFTPEQTSMSGRSTQFTRQSDAGRSVSFRFCPFCGSTVYWEAEAFPGHIAVAVGSFADPTFPAPTHSGWEAKRHHWLEPLRAMAIHHSE
ncbi:GFA family protein [Bosea sp. BK604]|uniref:GFA family protein n=1 Tax=Bosea sp. BK604 TaxID=2512180 RepID=UPI0032B70D95